jgi:hypothetical protein
MSKPDFEQDLSIDRLIEGMLEQRCKTAEDALEAERAKIARAQALHVLKRDFTLRCAECLQPMPCATARALDGEETE